MNLSCPSKTFLVGEYAVLNGGPGILINTPPYFKMESNSFIDPYANKGGFGASGARFLFQTILKNRITDINQLNIWDLLHNFKNKNSILQVGSGADIVSQFSGGIVFYDYHHHLIENLTWPFLDLDIILIHTGFKILTHQHLNNIKNLDKKYFSHLENIVLDTYLAIKNSDKNLFIKNINLYHQELDRLNLVCNNTRKIYKKLITLPEILALKGCGALGADVILILLETETKKNFLNWAYHNNINIIFSGHQFGHGLSIDGNGNKHE